MCRFVVIDVETTGLSRSGDVCLGHRLIEIACVEVVDGKRTGKEFHSYVKPVEEICIDPKATVIHGIRDVDLVGSPSFSDIVEDLLTFIGASCVVIHNAPFDLAFIDKEFCLLSVDLQPEKVFTYVDSLSVARMLFKGMKNDLNSLAIRLGLQPRGQHGALVDARLLADVVCILIKRGCFSLSS